ncbi:MAG: hypothetical protein ACFNUL_04075 [Cardiobacterium hominis]
MVIKILDTYYHTHRNGYAEPFRLRIHRALSWLKRADDFGDDADMRFVTLWIAFNAAYARDGQGITSMGDRNAFRQFLQTICRLDKEQRLYQLIWHKFSGSIRVLLENRYVFQPFWDFHNGKISANAWQEDFERANQKMKRALMNKDTDKILEIVFVRLYTLRNQLVHGGATWNSSANRQQLCDGCAILDDMVPLILQIMQEHHDDTEWGSPFYPFILN